MNSVGRDLVGNAERTRLWLEAGDSEYERRVVVPLWEVIRCGDGAPDWATHCCSRCGTFIVPDGRTSGGESVLAPVVTIGRGGLESTALSFLFCGAVNALCRSEVKTTLWCPLCKCTELLDLSVVRLAKRDVDDWETWRKKPLEERRSEVRRYLDRPRREKEARREARAELVRDCGSALWTVVTLPVWAVLWVCRGLNLFGKALVGDVGGVAMTCWRLWLRLTAPVKPRVRRRTA